MRLLLRLVVGLVLLGGVALLALWGLWGQNLPSVSDLDVLEFSGTTRVYDRQNRLITTLTPALSSGQSVNRQLLPLNQISSWAVKAVVDSEDRRFYDHGGVDIRGIGRGLLKGIFQNDLEGGSSITQQVVKNTLLSNLKSARTPERKFKEALLAYQLESHFTKDQILNAYLNVVYWGDGGQNDIIGIGAASQAYFRKPASQLNLAESVYLATIIPAPNKRYKDFLGYRPLMKDLLNRMVQDGRATERQAADAWNTPIYPSGWRIGWGSGGKVTSAVLARPQSLADNAPQPKAQPAFHFMQALEQELAQQIGRKALYSGGKVYATLDWQAQQAAEQASLQARLPDGATLGIALLDPHNGEVRALVGQKLTSGQRPSDWNNAVQARRQVGSSIKPLLYTLALSQGLKQSDTVLDAPIEGDYQPQNYDGRWTGRQVTLRYALDHSLNLPTVRLGQQVGMDKFQAKLRELGLSPPSDAGLSLSIGTLEASPLQMAAAYAPFANGGLYYAPSLVRKVEDAQGRTIYTRPAPQGQRVWDAQTAWLGLDMIRGVVSDLSEYQGGLATRAQIEGREVGGKTGTTNDIKDLWFVGTTPQLTGAVWVGKQAGGALPYWAYSGTIPTPIWQQAVAGALAGTPVQSFKQPSGIAYAVVRRVNMAFREQDFQSVSPAAGELPDAQPAETQSPASTPQTPGSASPGDAWRLPNNESAPSDAAPAPESAPNPDPQAPPSAYPQPEDLVPAPSTTLPSDAPSGNTQPGGNAPSDAGAGDFTAPPDASPAPSPLPGSQGFPGAQPPEAPPSAP